jgi:hypothetical protein
VTGVRRWDDPRWQLWQLAGFVLAHVAIFAGLFRGVYSMPFSGTGLYYEYGSAVVAGQVPYRDVFVEYPPLALVFFTLPRILGASFRWFYVWYQVEVVVGDLAIVLMLYAARERETAPWRVLAPYTALVLAVGPITLQQYDIFPAALTLAAVVCHARRRDVAAWVFLALGTMAKVYPVLLAPVFFLLDDRPVAERLRRAVIPFATTCVIILLPFLIIAPSSPLRMTSFHAERGIHLDSVYSTVAFAARTLGLSVVAIVYNFRSWNIAGPAASVLVRASTPLLVVALLSAYVFIGTGARRLAGANRHVRIVATSASLVLLAGLVTSKVLSPQYLIWVLPLLPLNVRPWRWRIWTTFAAIGVLSYYIYPLHYDDLLARQPVGVIALAARNLALVALTLMVAASIRRACTSDAARLDRSSDRVAAA